MTDDCTHIRVDDLVDDLLDEAEARRVRAHLAGCVSCARQERETRDLLAAAASLPLELPPARDLWPELAQKLRPAPPVPRWRFAALAAAALLLAGISSGLTAWWLQPAPDPWRQDLSQATATLAATLDARRGELDPETVRVIEENLQIIDSAIAEIEAALAQNPDDPRLEAALLAAWNQRLRLLVDANRITG